MSNTLFNRHDSRIPTAKLKQKKTKTRANFSAQNDHTRVFSF